MVEPKQNKAAEHLTAPHFDADSEESGQPATTPAFSLRQRLEIWLISTVVTLAIRLIGPTLRVTFEVEEGGPRHGLIFPGVFCFWHECIFSAAYIHRNRNIAVMTSRSFDGEYIARIIQNMGVRAVRGSSSRGGAGALLGMHRVVAEGAIAAFTIDGPRGPRHVAKPGAVLLARNTQAPLVCFHIANSNAWVLNTWDKMCIPKPFSRAHMVFSRRMRVPEDADTATAKKSHTEMQSALERVRDTAERRFRKNSAEPNA